MLKKVLIMCLLLAVSIVFTSCLGGKSTSIPNSVTVAPTSQPTPTAAVANTNSKSPNNTKIADDQYITATVEELVKYDGEYDYRLIVYVTNNSSSEILIGTVNGFVNDEMTTAVATGNQIKVGKSSRMHILLFGDNLSISSIDQITSVGFDMIIRDVDTYDTLEQIEDISVTF